MTVDAWWRDDPTQRFWMEITDREDLGADLFAPTANGSGRPYWGYELITYVQAGDVVLHWHKTLAGEPGVVGWSLASGSYEDTDISWQAHGSVGRASGNLTPRPAWRMPLLHYQALSEPVLISDVRSKEQALRVVLRQLETQHAGRTLYFPFGFSDRRELRAQQTYFVKMPREVIAVLGLAELEGAAAAQPRGQEPGARARKRRGSGYVADVAVRSAIEWRAVNLAVQAYEARGFQVEYTGATEPFDLVVRKDGSERRVEVKGSSGVADDVELTRGEVDNSRGTVPTDLFVVDGIQWTRSSEGFVHATGGHVRSWHGWTAQEAALRPTRYRYTLPEGGQSSW